jgi:hypothetical protein
MPWTNSANVLYMSSLLLANGLPLSYRAFHRSAIMTAIDQHHRAGATALGVSAKLRRAGSGACAKVS